MTGILALLVVTSLPGLVLLLIVVAAVDRLGLRAGERYRLPWRRPEDSRPVAATGLDEMQALFAPTKRYALDEKRSSLVLRDEEGDNAPPRTRVDLEAGVVRLHRP